MPSVRGERQRGCKACRPVQLSVQPKRIDLVPPPRHSCASVCAHESAPSTCVQGDALWVERAHVRPTGGRPKL
jgi:hypothetical protein